MSQITTNQMIPPPNLPFEVKPIINLIGKLPKHAKGDWLTMPTKRKDGSTQAGPRSFGDITHISIHHTAVEGGTPEGHARYHVGKGYGSIAYHVHIKGDQIHLANDLLALTWHTGSNNYHTVSVAIEGNFANRDMTEGERNALYASILTLMSVFNVPVNNVLGHKEYAQPTSCPCFSMSKVRTDLAALIEQMQYKESPVHLNAEIYAIVSRTNDLYTKFINKDKKYSAAIQTEAARKLGIVGATLKAEGWM